MVSMLWSNFVFGLNIFQTSINFFNQLSREDIFLFLFFFFSFFFFFFWGGGGWGGGGVVKKQPKNQDNGRFRLNTAN